MYLKIFIAVVLHVDMQKAYNKINYCWYMREAIIEHSWEPEKYTRYELVPYVMSQLLYIHSDKRRKQMWSMFIAITIHLFFICEAVSNFL